jgi:hypothetical protein
MRTSSEEYLAKRVQPAVALCGNVSSSYTMLLTQLGRVLEIRICGWQKPVVLESFQVNFVTILERGSMKRGGWLSTPT